MRGIIGETNRIRVASPLLLLEEVDKERKTEEFRQHPSAFMVNNTLLYELLLDS